jgi:hypothetical protein
MAANVTVAVLAAPVCEDSADPVEEKTEDSAVL